MQTIITFTAAQLKHHLKNSAVFTNYYETPAGILKALSTQQGIYQAFFVENSSSHEISSAIIAAQNFIVVGTELQCAVWKTLLTIPIGTTISYQHLAQKVEKPTAWRAVANAVGANPIAYFIPCHRIVRSNGNLGGYRWGIERKLALLKKEQQ